MRNAALSRLLKMHDNSLNTQLKGTRVQAYIISIVNNNVYILHIACADIHDHADVANSKQNIYGRRISIKQV